MNTTTPSAILFAALFTACTATGDPAHQAEHDKQAANKKAYEAIQNAFTTGDGSAFDTTIADNFVMRIPDPNFKSTGKDAFAEAMAFYRGAFPDMKISIKHLVAEGDWVIGIQQVTGTNTGPMGDMPATGRTVDAIAMDGYRFENGRAVENYGLFDVTKFMEQMGMGPGAAPPDSAAAVEEGAP